jgi:hypothetical protein
VAADIRGTPMVSSLQLPFAVMMQSTCVVIPDGIPGTVSSARNEIGRRHWNSNIIQNKSINPERFFCA